MNAVNSKGLISTCFIIFLVTIVLVFNNRLHFEFVDAVLHGRAPTPFDEFMFYNYRYISFVIGLISGLLVSIYLYFVKSVNIKLFIISVIFEILMLNGLTFGIGQSFTMFFTAYTGVATLLMVIMLSKILLVLIKIIKESVSVNNH